MDPAQNKDDQNKTTDMPAQDPVTPLSNTPSIPPTSAVKEQPTTPSPSFEENVPDPTSTPPLGADASQSPEPVEGSLPPVSNAAGTFDVPPIISPPAPNRSKAKIVGSILALVILLIGIPAGIFLVQQAQEIRERACDPEVEDCEPEPGEPGEEPAQPPVGGGTPSCGDDVEYCDGNKKVHKHGGYWDGNQCVYAFDAIGSCEEQPQCTDDLEYCDQEKGRQIHKHGGYWDGNQCIYTYADAGACKKTTPACEDDLEYCDQQTNKLIHKTGGYWDEDKEECVYAFNDKGACPDTRAHCSTAGFWCANNAVQCGAPHKRHPEFACDLPEQACCQIVSGGPQPPTGQCANVKAYDDKWNQLTASALSALKTGDSVRFAIGGSATNGSIDRARFKVNTGNFEETAQKNPKGEFFVLFTIPAGTNSFSINAQLHHTDPAIDWF